MPGSLRSAIPVVGSTLGSLQRVVRHEMSSVSGPIFAYEKMSECMIRMESMRGLTFFQLSSAKAGGPVKMMLGR